MPTVGDVHVDSALTDLSVAYFQDQSHFIADQVAPLILTEKKTGKYFEYDKNDLLRDEVEERAPGSESAGIDYDLTTSSWAAQRWAIHDDVDSEEAANADAPLQAEADAVAVVSQKMLIKRERLWAAKYFVTGVWGTEKDGGSAEFTGGVQWDDQTSSDPEKDIDLGKETVLQNTGKMPNTMVVGYKTHQALKQHPQVKEQFKYTSSQSITAAMLAQFFEIETYVVCKSIYASNVEGATAAYGFVQSDNALLCYVERNPGPKKPSAMYTFGWQGHIPNPYGVFIRRIEMPQLTSVRIEAEAHYVHQVVATDLGYFFLDCVA